MEQKEQQHDLKSTAGESRESISNQARTEVADIQQLLDDFATETKLRNRLLGPLGAVQSILLPCLMLLLLAATLDSSLLPSSSWLAALLILLLILPFTLIFTYSTRAKLSRKHCDILEQLARCQDMRAIGPLLEGTGTPNRALRSQICITLSALLLRLGPQDDSLLSDRDLRTLYLILDAGRVKGYQQFLGIQGEELMVALLHAVAEIGDQRALHTVQRLASEEAWTPVEGRIRSAARASLPRLQERIEQSAVRQNLLSPADGPATSTGTLLRPAHNALQADPLVLLRPDDPQ